MNGELELSLKQIDEHIGHNRYTEANALLKQLQMEHGSSQIWYRLIKSKACELKWSGTLPTGKARSDLATKTIREDYAGMICSLCEDYLSQFGSADPHYLTIQSLHRIAVAALGDRPCRDQSFQKFDQTKFLAGLDSSATLMKALESFAFSE